MSGAKNEYQGARDLTLARGLDLELVHADIDAQFSIDQGVSECVARHWVRDVPRFLEQYAKQDYVSSVRGDVPLVMPYVLDGVEIFN